MESRGSVLFVVLLLLAGAATIVLVVEDRQQRRRDRAEQFQHLVGGLGFGPALDLSGCAFAFDPRLDASCYRECGPVPGCAYFCPRHTGSVFSYPPLEHGVELSGEGAGDAVSP